MPTEEAPDAPVAYRSGHGACSRRAQHPRDAETSATVLSVNHRALESVAPSKIDSTIETIPAHPDFYQGRPRGRDSGHLFSLVDPQRAPIDSDAKPTGVDVI